MPKEVPEFENAERFLDGFRSDEQNLIARNTEASHHFRSIQRFRLSKHVASVTTNIGSKTMRVKTTKQTAVASYISNVLRWFTKDNGNITEDITDRVFLMIQSNPQFLQEYHYLIKSVISKHGLNVRLGKRIREHFCLQNTGRCNNPKSCLIKSYERHSK